MNFRRVVWLLFLLCSSSLSARSCAGQTAEEMLSACRPITQAQISNGMIDLPSDFESGTCWGAFGMLQQVLRLLDQNQQPALHACVPSDATRTELIAIYVKDVGQNPQEYGKDFNIVAINAVLKAYPCAAKKR